MTVPSTASLAVHSAPSSDPQRCGTRRRLLRLATRAWPSRRLAGWCLAGLAAGMLAAGYYASAVPITLTVDGAPRYVRTHQTSVEGVLREADIRLHPEDLVTPPLNTPLGAGSTIRIQLARPVTIEADGRNVELRTQRQRVADVLAEAGIQVKPSDEVLVDGQMWNLDADLPQAMLNQEVGRGPGLASALSVPAPVRIVLHRAVPVILTDGGMPVTFFTTQPTVGEALLAQDIFLYLGDRVTPSLGSRVLPGMRVYIERSLPVSIGADGQTLRTRTQRSTVGEALAQEGIALVGQDYSLPSSDTPLSADMAIRVVRVREEIKIEQETIPFETNWVATSTMTIDTQKVEQAGGEGLTKRRLRTVLQDGQAITQTLEDEWIDHPPSTKMIAYGTKVTVQKLETPDGTIEYWRHFRVLATSYSAATSGKEKDDPYYGITRTGMKATYGIVAVDPKVIALRSEVYIPGYGKAIAGDTGGSILGRHVDLAFDEDTPPLWYRWVDVYLLTPKPPANQIRYVLPNWPQER